MQHRNPVDHVRFYTKSNPSVAVQIRKNQVSKCFFLVNITAYDPCLLLCSRFCIISTYCVFLLLETLT